MQKNYYEISNDQITSSFTHCATNCLKGGSWSRKRGAVGMSISHRFLKMERDTFVYFCITAVHGVTTKQPCPEIHVVLYYYYFFVLRCSRRL